MKKKVAVIGSGIGGLAAAIRMGAKGHQVSVFEQGAAPGGKIAQHHLGPYRFDAGPTLLTMPWLVDELFLLAGENPQDHFRTLPLQNTCKYFWEDGTVINAWSDPTDFARESSAVTGVNPDKIMKALSNSRQLYEIMGQAFLFNSLHKPSNIKKKEFLKALRNVHKLDAFMTMHQRNQKTLDNKHLVQLFDRYATYNGSSPYASPATLNIIAHLEHNTGAWFPKDGMYSLVESLTGLAQRLGVTFYWNSQVQQVLLKNNKITGLKTQNGHQAFDLVISNIDIVNFYQHLLPAAGIPPKQLSLQRSSSALIFYWGIDRHFPQLDMHNILFSDSYRQEFEHLFKTKTISPDPTVYLFISSRSISGDAPAGHENWYVMINAPENTGQDWATLVQQARSQIINKINRILNISIETHIVAETSTHPGNIEETTGSYHGSLYGISSNSPLAAFYRHPNFRKKYQGLYFTGGSVHPGGGIPLCLASARIIDQEIAQA